VYTKSEQLRWHKRKRRGEIIDPDHLVRVREMPCLVCGARPSEAHHVLIKGMGGRNPTNDHMVVPLCPAHHRGAYSPHGRDADQFYRRFGRAELRRIAEAIWRSTVM